MRVDAHLHLWSVARGDYGWMAGNDAIASICRDFAPQDAEPLLRAAGIDKVVLVQAAPSVEETEYMLGLADATPWIGKVVGWINFEDASHRKHLERFARHAKFAGVRPMIQDLPDPEWMHRPDVQWAFQALIDLDLTFDALGYPEHLAPFLRLLLHYPKLRTVIDHGMKPRIRDGAFDESPDFWASGMARLASETGAFCKLSGLATEAGAAWTAETLAPYVANLVTNFGPDRLIWGSDWPVLTLNGDHANWLQVAQGLVPPMAQPAVFGGNAARFYRL